MLAEIFDKMGTAGSWWFLAGIFSAPLVYTAFRVTGKLGIAVVLVLAGGCSFLMTLAAAQEAFFEGEFSLRVQGEVGRRWIAHRIASGCLPIVLASTTIGLRKRWAKRDQNLDLS